MAFLGQVQVKLYFGVKYDDINVPFYSEAIEREAENISTLSKAAVWQTTWLTEVVADVYDYEAMVGCQYASIDDIGGTNHGRHWYKVLSYSQLSNRACLIEMEYDPLLSIGIGNISKISGILKRWSVDDDSPFKYTKSPEPLNQMDDYNYTYFRYNCADDALGAATGTQLYGFPYNLSEKPTVEEYVNPNGDRTSIFLPTMKTTGIRTAFKSSIGGDYFFTDNFLYWDATQFEKTVLPNLNAAIGLGYELMSNCWSIPKSEKFVTVNYTHGSIEGAVNSVIGNTVDVESGLPLYPTGYNNQKAADMGNFMSLYNEVTGDCVTVGTEDLSTTIIRIMCNPYVNGYFAARFIGYLHDPDGYSGIVKSAGWLPNNYTMGVGAGTAMAKINNAMQVSSVETNYQNTMRAYDTTLATANRNYNTRQSAIDTQFSVGQVDRGLGVVFNPFSLGSSIRGEIQANANYDIQQAENRTARMNALNGAITSLTNAQANRAQQLSMLSTQGNIGQVVPPPSKFSSAFDTNANSYTFVVRWTGLSGDDRKRLDNFFTAYGYNVDNQILNKASQLNTRTRFTFVQADDVEIYDTILSNSLQRLRDHGTVQQIKERFAAGLRIWYTTPDFDWTKPNPIRGAKNE